MPALDLRRFGPLYHSYRLLGAENEQLPGIYPPNQRCKEPILIAYIQWAIAKCRTAPSLRTLSTRMTSRNVSSSKRR